MIRKIILFFGSNKPVYNFIISGDELKPVRGLKLLVTPCIGEKIYFSDDGPFYIISNISHRVINTHEIWVTVNEL